MDLHVDRKQPELADGEVQRIVQEYFKLTVIKVTEANGYDDRNYIITTEQHLPDSENRFVLKITNPVDSSYSGLIDALTEVSLFVAQKGIESPVPIMNANGLYIERIKLQSGQVCAVRLMKFIEGTVLDQIDYDPNILYEIGSVVGRLSIILKDYSNPILTSRQMLWSLLNVGELEKYLSAIENDGHRALVTEIFKKFDETVTKKMDALRTSIIHGDINEQNVLVKKEDDGWSFAGLLDFGDSHSDPTIFDLAITCCYMTLDSKTIDPIEVPKYVISGYLSVDSITDQEWEILPICVMARLGQSLTLGAYNYLNNPSNQYLLRTGEKGWTILESLNSVGVDDLKKLWRSE